MKYKIKIGDFIYIKTTQQDGFYRKSRVMSINSKDDIMDEDYVIVAVEEDIYGGISNYIIPLSDVYIKNGRFWTK